MWQQAEYSLQSAAHAKWIESSTSERPRKLLMRGGSSLFGWLNLKRVQMGQASAGSGSFVPTYASGFVIVSSIQRVDEVGHAYRKNDGPFAGLVGLL